MHYRSLRAGALDLIGERVLTNDGTGTFSDQMRGVHGIGEFAPAHGEYELALQVPNTPSLAGAKIYWQGVCAELQDLRLTAYLHDTVLR